MTPETLAFCHACNAGRNVQSRRPSQFPANARSCAKASVPALMHLLLLLALLATSWHAPYHRHAQNGGNTAVSAPAEQPEEERLHAECEHPAKVRRQAGLVHAASPALPCLAHLALVLATAPARTFSLIPFAPHTAPQALPSPRVQRGQAPPSA